MSIIDGGVIKDKLKGQPEVISLPTDTAHMAPLEIRRTIFHVFGVNYALYPENTTGYLKKLMAIFVIW